MRAKTFTITFALIAAALATPVAFSDDDDWDDDDRRRGRHAGYVVVDAHPVHYDRVLDATRRLEDSAERLFDVARKGGVRGGHPRARAYAFDAVARLQHEARAFEDAVERRYTRRGGIAHRYERVERAAADVRFALSRVHVSGRVLRELDRVDRSLYRLDGALSTRVAYDSRRYDDDDRRYYGRVRYDDDAYYHAPVDTRIAVGIALPRLHARVVIRDND